MTDAYIFDGIRSPFGRHGGSLSAVRSDDLLAAVIAALSARVPAATDKIDDVIMGCTNQAGEDARNVARNAALLAGLPVSTPGMTVNRLCGSGLAATMDAARCLTTGQGALIVAGGVESMSRSPYIMSKADAAFDRGMKLADSTIGWRFPNRALTDVIGLDSMPETAENIAVEVGISRDACDVFAAASQSKYAAALARGFFDDEICAIEVPAKRRRDPAVTVDADEHPRPSATLDKFTALRPLSPDGVVTAGNASGINDGAAALLLGTRAGGEQVGLTPRGRLVAAAVAGVEPRVMGLGPVPAAKLALERAGLTLKDMDVIEINEAFAAQVLGCLSGLEIDYADSRVNPNGGAIAIGHPLGASGARLALTALRSLEEQGGRYALVSLCIGIGQGIAAIIERS